MGGGKKVVPAEEEATVVAGKWEEVEGVA